MGEGGGGGDASPGKEVRGACQLFPEKIRS